MRICLDPGHGGHDSGAVGFNICEKDYALKISNYLAELLIKKGFQVVCTRTDDRFIPLNDRVKFAYLNKCDLFISIHHNSAANSNANGYETWMHMDYRSSTRLAETLHKAIISAKIFGRDRGIKYGNFTVIKKTRMPACLVELGFVNNKEDQLTIMSKWKYIAEVMSDALAKEYLERKNVMPNEKIDGKEILDSIEKYTNSKKVSPWAETVWRKAVSKNVFDGTQPLGIVTREQLSVILDRLGLLND